MEKITRHIINEHISFDGVNRDMLFEMIDLWKSYLVSCEAKKGDIVALSILNVNAEHVAVVFACAELGLQLILLDTPCKEQTLHATKLALHGPADFCITDGIGDDLFNGLHGKMIRLYSKKLLHSKDKPNSITEYADWEVNPSDTFIISSTSGSTKPSRKIEFSHKECMTLAKRNIDIFKFAEDSVVGHSKNLHHASAMLCHLLPSLMVSDTHMFTTLPEKLSSKHSFRTYMSKVTHIMIPNRKILDYVLENVSFDNKCYISMCGFPMGQEYVDIARKHNLEFITHYGSIDTAIPLLVKYINSESESKEKSLGYTPDDFYTIELDNNIPVISCSLWSDTRRMEDILYENNGEYFIEGRVTDGPDYIEICKKFGIDINDFYYDTKINMEQLRAYVDWWRRNF